MVGVRGVLPRDWWEGRAPTDSEAADSTWHVPDPAEWDRTSRPHVDRIDAVIGGVFSWYRPVVVDLGCGVGRIMGPLAARHPQVTFVGVDVSRRMVGYAAGRHRQPNAIWVAGTGGDLPGAVAPVAAVYSMLLFQHLPGELVEQYLAEAARIASPAAVLYFQFVVGGTVDVARHDHREEQMVEWCKAAGWQVVAVDGDDVFGEWRWVTCVRGDEPRP